MIQGDFGNLSYENRRMEKMHLLSENSLWETTSEFVAPDGSISKAEGETEILVGNDGIENRCWALLNGSKIENFYSITKITDNKYLFVSENPGLGTQKGIFSVDRNIIYSKFTIENSEMNGFEVIIRNNDVCDAYGSLYNGDELINTWKATMKRKEN
jgi:hypothetical protein